MNDDLVESDTCNINIEKEQTTRSIDPRLLEILVCPVTKTTLHYDDRRQELISSSAGLAFPIRDGIPIMLLEEARQLGTD